MRKKQTRLDRGIHDAISAERYHADPCKSPSLSSSIANTLLSRSPLHAWFAHPRLNKKYVGENGNGRLDLGSAAHAVCLENDMSHVVKIDADSFRTNAAKEARDAAYAENKIPLIAENYEKLAAMQTAFLIAAKQCEELGKIQNGLPYFPEGGKAEQTIAWLEKDGKKKFWMRARPDWLSNDHRLIVDYKTVDSAEPEAFIRGPLVSHGYDVQAAFYLRGLQAVDLAAMDCKYIWILQEIEPPYAVSFVGYGEQMAEIAEQKVNRAIEIWKRCLTAKQWNAYSNKVAWANLPSYAVTRWEEWQAMQGFITSSEQLS